MMSPTNLQMAAITTKSAFCALHETSLS